MNAIDEIYNYFGSFGLDPADQKLTANRIRACDLGTGEKNRIFYQLTPDFDGFWFFAAY